MRLSLTAHHADPPNGRRADPDTRDFSEYRSSELLDDELARAKIMRRYLEYGVKGMRVVTGEEFRRGVARVRAAEGTDEVRASRGLVGVG